MSDPSREIDVPSSQVGVSNTEVQNAYKCELMWLYGFHPEMNYQVRKMGIARRRGIFGHTALENFYGAIKEETDYDKAAQEALNFIQAERVECLKAGMFTDTEWLGALNELYVLLEKYFDYYKSDVENFEILEIESFHAMEWENETDFYLPMRLDMVVYQKTGKFKGETSPWDHKFVYDFWKRSKFILNAQLPLYIRTLRAARFAGKPDPIVRRAIVNQIRTRPLKNPQPYDLFKRDFEPYTTKKINNVFNNHLKSAVRLAYLKRLPLDEAREEVKASFGSMACDFCDFKDLCDIQMEGGDPTVTIEATLKKNEYGYQPLEVMRRERD